MKVRIVASHFNRPDFIELQYKSIKKHIIDNKIEFMVINDALDYPDIRNWHNKNISTEIEDMCKKYNIRCERFPQNLHGGARKIGLFPNDDFFWKPCGLNDSNCRVSDVCQYGFNNFGKNFDGIYVIIDGDMFFEKDVSFNELIEGYDMVGHPQSRGGKVNYWWNGILIFNMKTLPNKHLINLDCGRIQDPELKANEPCDTAGQLYWYGKKTLEAKIRDVPKDLYGCLWDYGCGSNWWYEPLTSVGFVKKEQNLQNFIKRNNF